VRIVLTAILFVVLLGASGVYGDEAKNSGITFSLGFESFPGKTYYQLESVKYKKGVRIDSKVNPKEEDMNFSAFSLRATQMTRIGFKNLSAGIEVGMSFARSGYEKSWDLPVLTYDFWDEIHFPGFC
jgi:hypothetical protein